MHSRDRIVKAARELLKVNKIDNITVQQIIELADVSRRTFYRNFTDKYDVMNSLYTGFMQEQMGASVFPQDIKKYIHAVHIFFMDNKTVFQKAFSKDSSDSLTKAAIESINAFYRKLLQSYHGSEKFSREELDYLITFYSEGNLAVMEKWYIRNNSMSIEQLEHLTYMTLPPEDLFMRL